MLTACPFLGSRLSVKIGACVIHLVNKNVRWGNVIKSRGWVGGVSSVGLNSNCTTSHLLTLGK